MISKLGARLSIAGMSTLSLALDVTAQDILQEFLDPVQDAAIGTQVRSVGDLDGDGVVDFLTLATGLAHRNFAVYALSGADGAVLHRFDGSAPQTYFGFDLVGGSDHDGDGIADLAIGEIGYPPGIFRGRTLVYSGSDGSLLRQWDGEVDDSYFGQALDILPDLDGDGLDEWIVGAPYFSVSDPYGDVGRVYVYAGGSGNLIHRLEAGVDEFGFGSDVATLSDLDGDGFSDFVVAGQPPDARIFSGKTGVPIFDLDADLAGEFLTTGFVDCAGDIDGDAIDDIVVSGMVRLVAPRTSRPRLVVFSGADGSKIFHHDGPDHAFNDVPFFESIGVGDVNGDGTPDLLAKEGPPFFAIEDGYVRLVSGRTGQALYEFRDEVTDSPIPTAPAATGDLDGDGLADFAIGSPFRGPGRIRLYSGAEVFLNSERREPSVGDQVELRVSEGQPGEPSVIVVVEVGGVALFLPVFGIGHYGAEGFRTESCPVPPSLQGIEVSLRAYALHGGTVVVSAEERVAVQ